MRFSSRQNSPQQPPPLRRPLPSRLRFATPALYRRSRESQTPPFRTHAIWAAIHGLTLLRPVIPASSIASADTWLSSLTTSFFVPLHTCLHRHVPPPKLSPAQGVYHRFPSRRSAARVLHPRRPTHMLALASCPPTLPSPICHLTRSTLTSLHTVPVAAQEMKPPPTQISPPTTPHLGPPLPPFSPLATLPPGFFRSFPLSCAIFSSPVPDFFPPARDSLSLPLLLSPASLFRLLTPPHAVVTGGFPASTLNCFSCSYARQLLGFGPLTYSCLYILTARPEVPLWSIYGVSVLY